jgi:hypothetical protein
MRRNVVLPAYRIIGQLYILRLTLTIDFSQKKYKIFDINITPFEISFQYESIGIIFIKYILYFID